MSESTHFHPSARDASLGGDDTSDKSRVWLQREADGDSQLTVLVGMREELYAHRAVYGKGAIEDAEAAEAVRRVVADAIAARQASLGIDHMTHPAPSPLDPRQ